VVNVVTVLTIGGSDPTGGAGVQADLQTIASLNAHGAGVIAALTVQDTSRVHSTQALPADSVRQQLACLLADVRVHAVKTGMLATGDVVRAVAEVLRGLRHVPVVVDPVITSTSGHDLLDEEGVRELRRVLLPQAALVTPNLDEAQVLSGRQARTIDEMRECARTIADLGPGAVLVKGGHLEGEPTDVLYEAGVTTELPGERVRLPGEVHGTGCAFSAALGVFMARGHAVGEAARKAKSYVAAALRNPVALGRGAWVIDYGRAAAEIDR
jgi:hydroxymethylpyrimidine kinase/phosphomethylpyrimidine kinase